MERGWFIAERVKENVLDLPPEISDREEYEILGEQSSSLGTLCFIEVADGICACLKDWFIFENKKAYLAEAEGKPELNKFSPFLVRRLFIRKDDKKIYHRNTEIFPVIWKKLSPNLSFIIDRIGSKYYILDTTVEGAYIFKEASLGKTSLLGEKPVVGKILKVDLISTRKNNDGPQISDRFLYQIEIEPVAINTVGNNFYKVKAIIRKGRYPLWITIYLYAPSK